MSNSYRVVTPVSSIKGSDEEYHNLIRSLLLENYDETHHGFDIQYYENETIGEKGDIYIFATNYGSEEDLPPAFLTALGKLIENNNLPYLEFGYAQYDDKPRPGTSDGGSFRILPDGTIQYPAIVWPE